MQVSHTRLVPTSGVRRASLLLDLVPIQGAIAYFAHGTASNQRGAPRNISARLVLSRGRYIFRTLDWFQPAGPLRYSSARAPGTGGLDRGGLDGRLDRSQHGTAWTVVQVR